MGPSGGDSLDQGFQRQYSVVTISGPDIAIKIDFWIFASNEVPFATSGTNDVFSVKVNTKSYSWSAYRWSSCILSYSDGQGVTVNFLYKLTYIGFYSVSGTNALTLQIMNKLSGPSTLNSFGFRNVRIFTGSFNGQTEPIVDDFNRFPCLEYYFWNGTGCEPICNISCATCFGIKDNECLTCKGSLYNYQNGSCLGSCDSPFVMQPSSGEKYCLKKCPTSFYWYHNDSCSDSCLSPLTHSIDENKWDICSNPCHLNNTFLYPNGSCLSSCAEPLEQKMENGVKYCLNLCPNPFDYLYPDKSCSPQCSYPLSNRIEPVAKYCFPPCGYSSDIHLYRNGSCLPGCPLPYLKARLYNMNQCFSPCENPQLEYFYEADQVCKSVCLSPYETKTVNGVKVCVLIEQISPEEAEKTKSTASMIASQGQATQVGLKATSSFNSANPALALLAAQASMLLYILLTPAKFD